MLEALSSNPPPHYSSDLFSGSCKLNSLAMLCKQPAGQPRGLLTKLIIICNIYLVSLFTAFKITCGRAVINLDTKKLID